MLTLDPITLEVLRSRLEAIGEEAGAALGRTAISPVVTESKDYSCTLLDAHGRVVVGAGQIDFHFGAASNAIRSTLERHGDTIAPQDVFMANDPHNGGGLHPQDVMVQRPIFLGDRLIAWVVMSAHMMDVGGMVPGSFAPAATECYQEALRLPPVRLFRGGVEEADVWAIIRNNIRLADLVEMDLRSLVAGCHVAAEKFVDVLDEMGAEQFIEGITTIRDLTEQEMRRRFAQLTPGTYRAESWAEWDDEFFRIPCRLTVDGGSLVFDFEGASPQTNHFFNSKPYIIESEMVAMLASFIARDLPYNDGIFAPIELRCPEGTIVNATPPAPIAAAHMDVALNASEVGLACVRLALAASPDAPAGHWLTGWGAGSALGLHTWSGTGIDGNPDAFIMLDGNWVGSAAGRDRDGLPLAGSIVGRESGYSFTDIEILESWYPILVSEKRARPGETGAGRQRAGGGNLMGFQPHGTDKLTGAMLGMRRWLPLLGGGGGAPGACTEFVVRHADGSSEPIPTHASGVELAPEDVFEFRCASGGGFGDPLDRDPDDVEADVERGRFDVDVAARVYGVVLRDGSVDVEATAQRRLAIAQDRLARALSAPKPISTTSTLETPRTDPGDVPLYVGVVQRGARAISEQSGAVLAVAPDHWTDGCPVLVETRSDLGPEVHIRSYLDPVSGRALFVEAVPAGAPRSFESAPNRWVLAALISTTVNHDPTPTELDDVLDPVWLQWALADVGPDERVVAVEPVGHTQTLAQKIRFAVTVAGADGERTRSYCLKAHFGDGMESLLTEARVYRDLLPSVDIRVPRTYYAGINDATGRALLILDDLVAEGAHFVHDAAPYAVDQCRDALAQLARLHAQTWGDDRWAVDWLAPRIPAMLPMYSDEVLQALLDDGRGEHVPPELLDARRLRSALEATAELPPTCVVHGDTHSGNAYLDAQGHVCWLDWQITHRDHWSIDVAYHIGVVLGIEDRRSHEEELLRGYIEELTSLGVDAPQWSDAWDAYTSGFAWPFFLWTITRISSRAVVLEHMPRLGAAIADHDSFARLERI